MTTTPGADAPLNSYEKSDLAYDALKEAARARIDVETDRYLENQKKMGAFEKKVDGIDARVKVVVQQRRLQTRIQFHRSCEDPSENNRGLRFY